MDDEMTHGRKVYVGGLSIHMTEDFPTMSRVLLRNAR